MNTQAILNKISLLKAHAMEAMKIADILTNEVSRDSKPKKIKERPYDQQIANMLAERRKKRAGYTVIKKAGLQPAN